MSLIFTVIKVTDIRTKKQTKLNQKMTLIIKNSINGALLVEQLKYSRLEWNQKYQFISPFQENIDFILINGSQQSCKLNQQVIGKGKIFITKFRKLYQSQIQQKQLDSKKQLFVYEITLYSKQQQKVGVVTVKVKIELTKSYKGSLSAKSQLNLKQQLQQNPKYVKFYRGKSLQYNLFSLLDKNVLEPKFRFIQSIYRDLE